jgi:hypothetical protein
MQTGTLLLRPHSLFHSEALVFRNVDLSGFHASVKSVFLRPMLAGLAFALLLFVPHLVFAQTTGTLTGVVKDSTGAIVPGAKVKLVNQADKSVRATVTSGDAFFSFAALQPATYNLTVSFSGFEDYVVTGIEIHPGDNKTVETIALAVGRNDVSVTVTALKAGVDLSSPEKSFLITDEDIKRLSTVGRDVSELIRILPGFAVNSVGLNNDSTNNASQVAGFQGSSIGSFAANGAAPGAGAVNVISDGVNTTDPADASSSIGNTNMEMVAEVKVQTSNFGADSAKGPVVLNAISKSGGSSFHGAVYGYARNSALNSNDWIDNYFHNARAGTYNYFPGGNIGGPVKLPFLPNFNRQKKLTFFTGGEVYDQRNLFGNTATLSFVPTLRMLSGDLSTDSIEKALNLPTGASLALCPTPYQCAGLNNFGAGYAPNSTSADVQGNSITGGIIPASDISPNVSAYTRFYPKINRIPQPQGNPRDCTNGAAVYDPQTNLSLLQPGQLCSDNINYDENIFAQHNGFQYHARVDQNFSDATKLYVTYDYERVSDQSPVTNTQYAGAPVTIIPSPVGALTNAYSHRLSINNTHTFGPSLTNEVIFAGIYFFSPSQLQNVSLLRDANTGFSGARYYNNGFTQLPEINNFQGGVPSFGMGYFDPSTGAPKKKFSINGGDNLTKQLKTHSIKIGGYLEQTANNEYVQGYNDPQGTLNYSQYQGCNVYSTTNANSALTSSLGNSVGNFLNGCGGFTQNNKFISGDMKFNTLDAYATDEWKATKKLTLTYGIRFDHLGPWVDAHGQGLAVWEPEKLQKNVVYNLDPNDPTTWPGIAWHNGKGITLDSSLPLSGSPGRALFYSPRAGLAYDMYGDGKTTIRGGWGAYRFHDSYYTSDGPLLTSLGDSTYNIPGNYGCTLDQIANSGRVAIGQAIIPLGPGPFTNPVGQTCGGFSGTPFSIRAADKNDNFQPITYSYSFTVDQELGKGTLLEMSYVGNQTQHQLTGGNGTDNDTSNQNAIQLGGLYQPDPNISSTNHGVVAPINYIDVGFYNVQDWRPYPNYTAVLVENHIAYSNYNGLQLSLTKQRGALTYNINYTFSKALGIRGTDGNGSVGDSLNLRNNYGILPYNRREAANFTFSYQEGTKFHGNKYLAGALNQWEIASITSLQSGPDVAAFNSNFSTYGGYEYEPAGTNVPIGVKFDGITQLGTPSVNVQPVLTCNPTNNLPGISKNGAKTFINGNCFTLPAPGTNGSFSLPDIHGPLYFNSDLTLVKNFQLKEAKSFQFKLAGFNFLNHPNWQLYGGPAAGLGLGFGQNLQRGTGTNGQPGPIIYPTSDAAARAGLVQTSNNFGSTPYKSSLRILEVSFKYSF